MMGEIETSIMELGKAACSESFRKDGDEGPENLTASRLVSEAANASRPEIESLAKKERLLLRWEKTRLMVDLSPHTIDVDGKAERVVSLRNSRGATDRE
jgi:hypothetical protein